MADPIDAVVGFVALVSPGKARAVAAALRGLQRVTQAPTVNSLVDTPAARSALRRVFFAWAQEGSTGDELAGMLLGASGARQYAEREQSVELVWTGPTTSFVPMRRTEQVLVDLIDSASQELFLVSFVAYDVPTIFAALSDAAGRGVRVRVLLEACTSQGGTLSYDAAALVRASVPAAQIFTWKQRAGSFTDGKVHAKLAVVDGKRVFITSANITSHALEKNMEAGVVINGGPLPKTLSDHLQALIDVRSIERA